MLEQSQPVTALAGNKNARDCKSFNHYETKLLSKMFLTPREKEGYYFAQLCVCVPVCGCVYVWVCNYSSQTDGPVLVAFF